MPISTTSEYENERLRSQVATLTQLLAVHEKTALEQSRRLESIVASISDGFFVLDKVWRVTWMNPVASGTFGRMGVAANEIVGRPLWAKLPARLGTELPENCQRAMTERMQTTFELYVDVLDAYFEFHAYPWEDGVSVFFQDVSARKVAERKREQNQTELERLVQLRTADLQAMLGELEAFSYSVSH